MRNPIIHILPSFIINNSLNIDHLWFYLGLVSLYMANPNFECSKNQILTDFSQILIWPTKSILIVNQVHSSFLVSPHVRINSFFNYAVVLILASVVYGLVLVKDDVTLFSFFSPQIAKFQLQCKWKFLNFFLFGLFGTNVLLNPDTESITIFASRLGVQFILDPIFYFPFLTKRDGISIRYMSEQFYQVLECFRRAFFTSQIFHLPARIA